MTVIKLLKMTFIRMIDDYDENDDDCDRAKMTVISHHWWLWSGWVIIDDYDEHNDDCDRAKMTNGSGVWRLPECHTLMRWLLFIPLFLHLYFFLHFYFFISTFHPSSSTFLHFSTFQLVIPIFLHFYEIAFYISKNSWLLHFFFESFFFSQFGLLFYFFWEVLQTKKSSLKMKSQNRFHAPLRGDFLSSLLACKHNF